MSSFQFFHLDVPKHFETPRCVLWPVDLTPIVFINVISLKAEITYDTTVFCAVCLCFSSHNVTVLTF